MWDGEEDGETKRWMEGGMKWGGPGGGRLSFSNISMLRVSALSSFFLSLHPHPSYHPSLCLFLLTGHCNYTIKTLQPESIIASPCACVCVCVIMDDQKEEMCVCVRA